MYKFCQLFHCGGFLSREGEAGDGISALSLTPLHPKKTSLSLSHTHTHTPMACHHPHQCCCCCCSSSSHQHSPPPPQPPSTATTDSALLTIAAYLASSLHYQSSTPPSPPPQSHTNDALSIQPLLHRLSALETTLHHLSLRPPQSPPSTPSVRPHTHPQLRADPTRRGGHGHHLLRNHAARTIQTHFRSFLVRRSQTLRHLKLIAFAQTFLNNLRSRLADRTQLHLLYQKSEARHELAEKTADLLAKIREIQSGDLMIREAKRSVSRDLVGVLDVLDGSSGRNGCTKIFAAGESSPETRDYSRVGGKPQKRFTVRRKDLEPAERGEDDVLLRDFIGKDGIERKVRVSDEESSIERVVGILGTHNGGWCSSGEKSQKEDFEHEFPGFQHDGNSGLGAPVPLHMEARGVDSVKEKTKINVVRFDLPE